MSEFIDLGNGVQKLHVRTSKWKGIIVIDPSGMVLSTKLKPYIGLGDMAEKVINTVTLGQGHNIANAVANAVGSGDCGCNKRKETLNKIGDAIVEAVTGSNAQNAG